MMAFISREYGRRKKNKKQSEDEGKLRVARKEDYRSKVFPEVEQSIKKKTIMTLAKMLWW